MSLWWRWMVIRVSNFLLSIFVRFCVVTSMSMLSISRKTWSVLPMIFLSCRALWRATSESLVHMNWIPKIPIWKKNRKWYDSTCICISLAYSSAICTCAGKLLRKSIKSRLGSSTAMWAFLMTTWTECSASLRSDPSQNSTFPWAMTGLSNWKYTGKFIYQRYLGKWWCQLGYIWHGHHFYFIHTEMAMIYH